MALCVAGSSRRYVCSLRSAARCSAEKSLSGEGWRSFVVAEGLKVGDVLRIRMGGVPLYLIVEIIRVLE